MNSARRLTFLKPNITVFWIQCVKENNTRKSVLELVWHRIILASRSYQHVCLREQSLFVQWHRSRPKAGASVSGEAIKFPPAWFSLCLKPAVQKKGIAQMLTVSASSPQPCTLYTYMHSAAMLPILIHKTPLQSLGGSVMAHHPNPQFYGFIWCSMVLHYFISAIC